MRPADGQRAFVRIAPLLLVCVILAGTMDAQSTLQRRIWLDNDYFNFWLRPDKRPDNDYTQGISVEVPFSQVASLLAKRSAIPCGKERQPLKCIAGLLELKQEIYTPEQDAPALLPGQRPYLGWLGIGTGVRWLSPGRVQELRMEVGVTGPPSLAEASQKAVHGLLGFREPLGWDGQIPFEPGLVVSYGHAQVIGELQASGRRVASLTGHSRIRLGNFVSDVRAGGCLTLGWNVTGCHNSWIPHIGGFGVGLRAGFSGDLVLHHLSLDGSTFADGPRVDRKLGVVEGMIGLQVRIKGLLVEWTAIRRSREYSSQTTPHTFSRIALTF
jgi:lipid A 3-O-deacylase